MRNSSFYPSPIYTPLKSVQCFNFVIKKLYTFSFGVSKNIQLSEKILRCKLWFSLYLRFCFWLLRVTEWEREANFRYFSTTIMTLGFFYLLRRRMKKTFAFSPQSLNIDIDDVWLQPNSPYSVQKRPKSWRIASWQTTIRKNNNNTTQSKGKKCPYRITFIKIFLYILPT